MDSLQGGGDLLPDPGNSVHVLYLGSRQNQQLSVWSRYLDNVDLNRRTILLHGWKVRKSDGEYELGVYGLPLQVRRRQHRHGHSLLGGADWPGMSRRLHHRIHGARQRHMLRTG